MNRQISVKWCLSTLVVMLSCSPEASKVYRPAVYEKVTTNRVVVDPRVDILFVVDNSYSMDPHQANLANNVARFTSQLKGVSFLQYNIGVITTDNSIYGSDCCGRLQGTPRFVTNTTQNMEKVLAANFEVGVNGSSSEAVFDPVQKALTNPLQSGWNAGFYRPGASLALMFITDAEDQSTVLNPKTFYDFLLKLKNGDPSKVLGYGAIVPSDDTMSCNRDEPNTEPKRIEAFLKMLPNHQNNIMNLCDPDYGTRLADLAKSIVTEVTTIRLTQVPYVPSIKVIWGSIELPSDADLGWAYDAKQNAIILGRGIDWTSQPSGSQMTVTFDVAKYPAP